jgi:exodeoxyribonuclease-5
MLTTLTLTPDQQRAHDTIVDFAASSAKLLTLGGYAGTGKTTLVPVFVDTLRQKNSNFAIAFCAFTGKASLVLKQKLSGILASQDYCGTIHGLMYQLIGITQKNGRKIMHWAKADTLPYDLIVIDEASMVDGQIYQDIASYGVPILAIGDHGQLPPVQGRFNLMERPDMRLEKIMRQAEGNHIIHLATMARERGYIPPGEYGPGIKKVIGGDIIDSLDWSQIDITLCGTNKTRVWQNHYVRGRLGNAGIAPRIGEPVICLRNNKDAGIFNGNIGVLTQVKDAGNRCYLIDVDMGGWEHSGLVLKAQFGNKELIDIRDIDSFDWAYCITTHKAQGGEWPSVVLIEERFSRMTDDDWRRWLYTAVTRAKERLLIIGKW